MARELYKDDLNDPVNLDCVVTHLEPDILECEVKAVIGNINRTNLDGIPAELFKIRKDDAVKMLHSICQQLWKAQQWPQDWKRSVFNPIPKKDNAKEGSNVQLHSFYTLGRSCSKSFKLDFSSM